MVNKEIIKLIFTHPYINKKLWIFKANINWSKTKIKMDKDDDNFIEWENGIWKDGTWYDGIWRDGKWKDGIWQDGGWYNGEWLDGTWHKGSWHDGIWENGKWYDGTWEKGNIYNPKTGRYEPSKLPPNKCKWSLSYGK